MTTEAQVSDDYPPVCSTEVSEKDMLFSSLSRLPVIVILGATGTGKSKLAISLAKRFNGEIISTDSMQVYKGLDILTNKVTVEEMDGVPHHMIGMIEPSAKYDVVQFQEDASPIIKRILLDGKIPFLVGGTNYYIESLLWKVLIKKGSSESVKRKSPTAERSQIPRNQEEEMMDDNDILKFLSSTSGNFYNSDELIQKWTSQELHAALQLVDSERAHKLHPNDSRKIARSLQVRLQTGKKHSELIEEQQKEGSNEFDESYRNTHLGGPLRYPNSFCLWIQAPKPILHQRINSRVDEMMKLGLRAELDDYIDQLRIEASHTLDFTSGLLQSIGFKEFHDYLQLSPDERHTEEGDKKFAEGAELLKIATRQYAKRQLQWINQRYLRPSRRQIPPVYWLDGSEAEVELWTRNVQKIAETIIEAHLLNQGLVPLLKERLVPLNTNKVDDLVTRTCSVCDGRVFVGLDQFDQHMKSYKHKRMLKRKNALVKREVVRNESALEKSDSNQILITTI